MEVFGWAILVVCGVATLGAGVVYAFISSAFSGRVERLCYGYAIVGGGLLAFCYTTCPFKLVFK